MASSECAFGGWDSEDKVKEEIQEFIDIDDGPDDPLPDRQCNYSAVDNIEEDSDLMEKQGSYSVLL